MDKWSEFKEEVRARTDIVALIGETRTVTPRRGGQEYVTLCPFHDDHKPSMTISPERQTYRCWVCDEGGDCFSYLQKLENLQFPAALEQLALRAGLEMPQSRPNGRKGTDKNTLFSALNWASHKLHECLLTDPAAEVARDYLLDRGFCEEIWTDFELGFHPGPWQWLLDAAKGQFTPQQLEEARLAARKQGGNGYFDHNTIRNRIIFPIRNERGQTIAFGGRALPDSEEEKYGKYQNSQESFLFNKSKQLYGLDHAKEAIRDRKEAIVVEGYTDCISLHQVGIANVVATLGTALTHDHVSLLRRFCENVILIFDGDQAGQNAANRALPRLLSHDIELRLLALPEGMDPPEFLERHGVQEFQELLQNAQDAWEFKLNQLVREHGTDTILAKEKITAEMLQLIAVAPDLSGTKREDLLLNRLANQVGLRGPQEQILRRDLNRYRSKGPKVAPQNTPQLDSGADVDFSHQGANDHGAGRRQLVDELLHPNPDLRTSLERDLLEIALVMPECITVILEQINPADIRNPVIRDLLALCSRQAGQQQYTGIDSLLTELEDPESKRLLMATTTSAEQKQMTDILEETTQDSRGNRVPRFLVQVIDQLNWEERKSQHRTSRTIVVDREEPPASVDDRMRQLLQDAAQFHQQRVTRNTASSQ